MKSYSLDIKMIAKQMYLQGKAFADIGREIGCHPKTVSKWAKQNSWNATLNPINSGADVFIDQPSFAQASAKINQLTRAYQQMLLTGISALPHIRVRSASEAGRLIDQAVKGIDSLQQGYLHTKFLIELGTVLKSEITDKDLLRRILDELVEVYENHDHRRINPPA